ncbi:precorrin-6y C5,15-methyltransferase (decarboxylating), CbiE subunit [Methanoregula boonei 6A8]|uniref:Precorrin-6y C5,15-methyltransferase (Decarboxylating), CbiE subunit n=1 Tax=Methanoregula boonei (strain DSM 21154 / JCM 14090 / 6A8) TaxID=456442 RepID=A7I7N0_METB6|nr:cobalt-precorrin-7 (C(5))-methyltransferase [Methanoregula boonei]ABS55741.1 precorrin-6y C5,15-methyltransferase (decarboxylating), CbiE subunit [Methanoregula boonei 6A8]
MKIVGVGCGPGLITEQAVQVIRSARLIYGSGRAIEMVQKLIPPTCVVRSISDYRNLAQLPENAVVLSTGDPMLAGLGYLPGEVVPGISSLQVAAARLHLPLSRVAVIVAHGRGHDRAMQETIEELRREKVVFLIADPRFDVDELYRRLGTMGLPGQIRIAVCENLGYPDEQILTGDLAAPPLPDADLYSLVIGQFGEVAKKPA